MISEGILSQKAGFFKRGLYNSHTGRDTRSELFIFGKFTFRSTRPVRGETAQDHPAARSEAISIHSPRAGRDAVCCRFGRVLVISIHSPRAGRDALAQFCGLGNLNFNPLAPCGARRVRKGKTKPTSAFQSTRPVRGETLRASMTPTGKQEFQSTRPVRGETRHSGMIQRALTEFQSTRPVRGETSLPARPIRTPANFNPLAPCGARLKIFGLMLGMTRFQSTRPARGETASVPS